MYCQFPNHQRLICLLDCHYIFISPIGKICRTPKKLFVFGSVAAARVQEAEGAIFRSYIYDWNSILSFMLRFRLLTYIQLKKSTYLSTVKTLRNSPVSRARISEVYSQIAAYRSKWCFCRVRMMERNKERAAIINQIKLFT